MTEDYRTTGSVRHAEGVVEKIREWFVLGGDREVVAALVTVAIALLAYGLIVFDIAAVGPGSMVGDLFASGFIGGILTLVTIALSINQLILSRVFGSPDELLDEHEGATKLRERIRRLAGEPSAPNDPANYLLMVTEVLTDRADRLASILASAEWDPPPEVHEYVDDVGDYGDDLAAEIEPRSPITGVLLAVLGSGYAVNYTATEGIRNEYRGKLPPEAVTVLEEIDDCLEILTVTRQFFKTLSLQQDFARLSAMVAYTGLVAVLTSVFLGLLYRTDGVTISESLLPIVVSVGIGVVVLPLVVFVVYILRAATIARHTVSVGPFVAPKDGFED